MGFVDFGRAYKRAHPHASKSLIRKKYARATYVMFGKKTRRVPEEANTRRSRQPTPAPAPAPRTIMPAAPATIASMALERERFLAEWTRKHALAAPRSRKSSTAARQPRAQPAPLARANAESFIRPGFPVRANAESVIRPLEPDAAPVRADSGVGGGALDRLDSSYVPADDLIEFHDRNDLVDITSIHKCKLPEWMKTITAKITKPAGWTPPHPVYIIPRTIEYIFGVCGTVEEKITQVLRAIKDTRELSSIYQGMFMFEIEHSGEKRDLKKDADLTRDLKNFIKSSKLIAYFHLKSTPMYHARTLFKDEKTKTVYVLDPLGHDAPRQDVIFLPAINKLVRGFKNPNYTKVEFKKGRQDQRNEEKSCGAVTFTRMVYAAYNTHKNPGTAPMDYIYQALPCRYAIFVSELFQRVDVITSDTHTRVVTALSRKLLANRIRDRPLQEEERRAEQLRLRLSEAEESKDDIYA
jgi:hypothetical protein